MTDSSRKRLAMTACIAIRIQNDDGVGLTKEACPGDWARPKTRLGVIKRYYNGVAAHEPQYVVVHFPDDGCDRRRDGTGAARNAGAFSDSNRLDPGADLFARHAARVHWIPRLYRSKALARRLRSRHRRELWTIRCETQSRPAAGEGPVFVAEPEALAALREADGSEAWRVPLTERLVAPLVWDNGWLVAATASGALLALRGLDGHLVWRRDLGLPVSAPPVLAADRVYAPARDGRIIALRVDTGEPLWERRLGGTPTEMLALDDRIYVGSDDNFFYCLTAKNGQIDWRWRTGGDIVGAAVVDDRRVYLSRSTNCAG